MVFLSPIQVKKIRITLIVFIAVAIAMAVLLFRWQISDSQRFVAIANERYKDIRIPSVRGSILAADGSTLAYSEPRYDVFVWIPELESAEKENKQTREEFVIKVAETVGLDPSIISAKFTDGAKWLKIADKVTFAQRNALLNLKASSGKNLTGVQFEYVNRRIYPEGKLASQALGYVGLYDPSEKGIWGLEQYWDGTLRPLEGVQSTEYDSFGNPIALAGGDSVESKPGSTLYTTIDKGLQATLEQKLSEGFTQFKAESLTGIILDPKTGAILAMANYPNFDPNKYFEQNDSSAFGNKAISSPYEVGSVAKTLTLAAALDSGTVTPDTVILPNGHNGCEIISPNPMPEDKCLYHEINNSEKIIDCICVYNRGAVKRSLTVFDALIGSDNIAFHHIAMTLSYKQFYSYLDAFGAGKPTQVDLPSESYANLKPVEKWNYADQAVYSYGHGYSMTPLETVAAIGALVNGGKRMQPYLVSKVVDSDNKVTEFNPKVVAQVVKKETADTVSSMMHQVYLNQLIEKRFKSLSKYQIGLKSGTALIPYTDRPGYSSEINTTFVGFDNSPEKRFVMLIKMEKPQVGELSVNNVRILWLDTLIAIKDQLHLSQ